MVAAGTLAAGAVAAPAAAAPLAPLGPKVIKTDAPPTGYVVTFRYQAPEGVNQVHIYGDWFFANPSSVADNHPPSEWQPGDTAATPWRIMPMRRGADGVWAVTVPLPGGTFRYAFTHDCVNVEATGCTLHDDPANRWQIQPQYPGAPGAVRSTIYVPGSATFPTYDNSYQAPPKANKAGKLESRRYTSPLSTNPAGVHDIVVYTPWGYDPNRVTPYPTLYISHGGGDHSTAWTMQGVAHHILENAIADKAAQPMVLVSTDFNGLPGGNQGYANELRNNVIPFVEQNYNVSKRSQDRAFGGFSAGASRAFTIMYDNTNLFGYHAAWSSGAPAPSQVQIDSLKTAPGGVLFGTGRQDGSTATSMQTRAEALRTAGVDIDEYYVDGMHTWHVWRPMLNNYVRTLAFRTTTTSLEFQTAPVGQSQNVKLTATARVGTVTNGTAFPSGKVEFYAGDNLLGSAKVQNGLATISKTFHRGLLDDGPLVARYLGDKTLNPSASAGSDVF
ncbi:alpha/beta hydrolase-fold protein [Phytohabitans kaempferiae]|uniref:Alpha/beta hydrolase-fold protein n=1 Tax=Phytohabitans kaempferiae TaxID=1620943 RepID=A0ABV6M6H1_9ACTN